MEQVKIQTGMSGQIKEDVYRFRPQGWSLHHKFSQSSESNLHPVISCWTRL
jgi:hypothetical protein